MATAKVNTVRTPLVFYSILALLVLLPMLRPGYILTLDMAFTPTLRMPTGVTSSYLFNTTLHVLNFAIPSQVLQKLLLFLILILSGWGAHRLLKLAQAAPWRPGYEAWGAYLAGTIYMINPFTYGRFMAGQYAVLLGYALLPSFVGASLKFFANPARRTALQLAMWTVLVGVVSIHTLGLAAVVLVVQCGLALFKYWGERKHLLTLAKYGLLTLAVFIVASSYWLAPLVTGSNTQAQAITHFTTADRQAFATLGGNTAGRIGHVLQLRGFWADGRGLYTLPQHVLAMWPLAMIGLWVLAATGVLAMWRRRQRTVALLLLMSGAVAVAVASGGPDGWLATHLPLFSGYREPEKFVGLVVLTFALFAGQAAAATLGWAQRHARQLLFNGAAMCCLLLPVVYTPTMFWGFAGQLTPREYPADWALINSRLNSDSSSFKVLFLPWHLYMSFGFAGRIIVNPAPAYFDKPAIASNQLEFNGASPTVPDPQKDVLTYHVLPAAPSGHQLGKQLSPLSVKYVLLAKDYDYRKYDYLNHQTDLVLVQETPHLKLYKVVYHG
ncbi:MAG TPA: hypothetical protein VLH84_00435 [Patescibacteria group bacterium]|nr:hypothetical protein [Patescibacteria group bacterium]